MVDTQEISIGPYDLRRSDLLKASLFVSFRGGSVWLRAYHAILLMILSALTLSFLLSGDFLLTFLIAMLGAFVFLIGPILRFRAKNHRAITLTIEEEGLCADVAAARVIYKWPQVGRTRLSASGLYVMIGGHLALAIPRHAVTSAEICAFKDAIDRRRGG